MSQSVSARLTDWVRRAARGATAGGWFLLMMSLVAPVDIFGVLRPTDGSFPRMLADPHWHHRWKLLALDLAVGLFLCAVALVSSGLVLRLRIARKHAIHRDPQARVLLGVAAVALAGLLTDLLAHTRSLD